MKKAIFSCILIVVLGYFENVNAQNNPSLNNASKASTIKGLTIFPNPVSNGKLYIITAQNGPKTIEVFDVLGKRIIAASILGKALNVSKLSPGIYIIKVKENNTSFVRKLIVR